MGRAVAVLPCGTPLCRLPKQNQAGSGQSDGDQSCLVVHDSIPVPRPGTCPLSDAEPDYAGRHCGSITARSSRATGSTHGAPAVYGRRSSVRENHSPPQAEVPSGEPAAQRDFLVEGVGPLYVRPGRLIRAPLPLAILLQFAAHVPLDKVWIHHFARNDRTSVPVRTGPMCGGRGPGCTCWMCVLSFRLSLMTLRCVEPRIPSCARSSHAGGGTEAWNNRTANEHDKDGRAATLTGSP
jgi:hypothetical protein